jgi:hypothetical protein
VAWALAAPRAEACDDAHAADLARAPDLGRWDADVADFAPIDPEESCLPGAAVRAVVRFDAPVGGRYVFRAASDARADELALAPPLPVGVAVRRDCADGPLVACDAGVALTEGPLAPGGAPVEVSAGDVLFLLVDLAAPPVDGPVAVHAIRVPDHPLPRAPRLEAWRDGDVLAWRGASTVQQAVSGYALALLDAQGRPLSETVFGAHDREFVGAPFSFVGRSSDRPGGLPGAAQAASLRMRLVDAYGLAGAAAEVAVGARPAAGDGGRSCDPRGFGARCAADAVCAANWPSEDGRCVPEDAFVIDRAWLYRSPAGDAFGLRVSVHALYPPPAIELWADGRIRDLTPARVEPEGDGLVLTFAAHDDFLAGARRVRVAVHDEGGDWSAATTPEERPAEPDADGGPCDPLGVLDACPAGEVCTAIVGGAVCRHGGCPNGWPYREAVARGDVWVAEGDTTNAGDRGEGTCGRTDGRPAADQIVGFTAPEAGRYVFEAVAADPDAWMVLHVWPSCASRGRPAGETFGCDDEGPHALVSVRLEAGEQAYAFVDGLGLDVAPTPGPYQVTIRRAPPPVLADVAAFRDAAGAAVGVRIAGRDPDGDLRRVDVDVLDAQGRVTGREADLPLQDVAWDGAEFVARASFPLAEERRRWAPARLRVVARDDAGNASAALEAAVAPAEPVAAGAWCDESRAQALCPAEAPCILGSPPGHRGRDSGHCLPWTCPPAEALVVLREGEVEAWDDATLRYVQRRRLMAPIDFTGAPPLGGSSCGGGTAGRFAPFTARAAGDYVVHYRSDPPGDLSTGRAAVYVVADACPAAGRPPEMACQASSDAEVPVHLEAGQTVAIFAEQLDPDWAGGVLWIEP